jgi:hypothetical protein
MPTRRQWAVLNVLIGMLFSFWLFFVLSSFTDWRAWVLVAIETVGFVIAYGLGWSRATDQALAEARPSAHPDALARLRNFLVFVNNHAVGCSNMANEPTRQALRDLAEIETRLGERGV